MTVEQQIENLQTTNFELVYEGGKTDQNKIDADVLGQSLLAFAELVREANELLNGSSSEICIEVTAYKEGSFETLFSIAQMGGSLNVAEVLGIAGGSVFGGGLIAVIQKLKGRKVHDAVIDEQSQNLVIDGEVIESEEAINTLLHSNSVRKELSHIFHSPVSREVTAKLYTENKAEQVLEVGFEQLNYFRNQLVAIREDNTETVKKYVRIAAINFATPKSGWKMILPDDVEAVAVKIADDAFWKKVQTSSTRFSIDDLFYVELAIKTTDNGLAKRKSYTITKVIEHLPADGKDKMILNFKQL